MVFSDKSWLFLVIYTYLQFITRQNSKNSDLPATKALALRCLALKSTERWQVQRFCPGFSTQKALDMNGDKK